MRNRFPSLSLSLVLYARSRPVCVTKHAILHVGAVRAFFFIVQSGDSDQHARVFGSRGDFPRERVISQRTTRVRTDLEKEEDGIRHGDGWLRSIYEIFLVFHELRHFHRRDYRNGIEHLGPG